MKKLGLLVFVIRALNAQTSPCDVNHDGVVNIADVQTMINEALGVVACTTDLSGDGKCDVIDVQIVIGAALGGACNAAAQPAQSNIQLPVEVIGLNGTTKTVSFNIPSGSNLTGTMQLSMRIHGLRYETQASVQVNNSAWMPISSSTVTLLGQANAYGGIGGGFHTLQMTMNLAPSLVVTGLNKVTFLFNGTDGRVSGFRVLAFNFLGSDGNALLPASTFVNEDPNKWQPPSTAATDIADGKTLWYTAALRVPTVNGPVSIKANCTSCHAQDGRDLKYFNYSNNSIRTRSMFHGLTAQQGDQIASYIRSLDVPNPGRPWNPPYQPGPGLDSQLVDQWSAGAGLDAVVDSDQAMLNELFPSGIQTSFFSPNGTLNVREAAIALQVPDWNSWLPTIHPLDAWSDFASSGFNNRYARLRSELQPGSPTAYANSVGDFQAWGSDYQLFMLPKISGSSLVWSQAYVNQVYSTLLWVLVKNWELNQEFELEGMARTVYTNPKAEPRAWLSGFVFLASPNMLHIPPGSPGLDNGSLQTWTYLAFIWYHMQLILNNSEYQQHGNSPIDWQYTYSFIKDMSSSDSAPQAALLNLWLAKGIQISNNGMGPDQYNVGWNWLDTDNSREVSPGSRTVWTGTIGRKPCCDLQRSCAGLAHLSAPVHASAILCGRSRRH